MAVFTPAAPHRQITYIVYKPHHDSSGKLSWHGAIITPRLREARKEARKLNGIARIIKKETIIIEFAEVVQWESFEATDYA